MDEMRIMSLFRIFIFLKLSRLLSHFFIFRKLLHAQLLLSFLMLWILSFAVYAAEMKKIMDSPLSTIRGGAKYEIQAFSALPSKLFQPGEPVAISWSVPGATKVTLVDNSDGTRLEGLQAEGLVRVAPSATTTYTLFANGPSGSKTAKIEVTLASEEPVNHWKVSSSNIKSNSLLKDKKVQGLQALQKIQQGSESISASLTAMDDGSIYQGSFDGNYYQFSAEGDMSWTLEDAGVVMNQAAVLEDIVFVGANSSEGGRVLALKPDKSILWEVNTTSGVIASPVINTDSGILYAVSYNGTVLALNNVDGNELWRYQLPDGATVNASPTLSEDGTVLYIHSTNHRIFALRTEPEPKAIPLIVIPIPDGPVVIVPKNNPTQDSLEPELELPTLLWQRDLQSES
jgi:hypothetical protein